MVGGGLGDERLAGAGRAEEQQALVRVRVGVRLGVRVGVGVGVRGRVRARSERGYRSAGRVRRAEVSARAW